MQGSDFINYALDTLRNDPRYANVDLSTTSAFYNLNILPFTVLFKPVYDLNQATIKSLQPELMTSAQLDNYGKNFFAPRGTETMISCEVKIYLKIAGGSVEPLIVSTTDQFKTTANETFYPVQDYIFLYQSLPTVVIGETTYKVATILTKSQILYSTIQPNTITTSTVTHPQYDHVNNTLVSSNPIPAETDTQFLESIKNAFSLRGSDSPSAIYTNIKNAFNVSDILRIGYGDPEMQRDIAVAGKSWSGHFGNMIDIYVKTTLIPTTFTTNAYKISDGTGYSFIVRRYKGYDWYASDNAQPDPLQLAPWKLIETTDALPLLPIVSFDWANTVCEGLTLVALPNGEVNFKVEVMPDPLEKSYGKNYRYSIYESLRITFYTTTAVDAVKEITLAYSTLSDLENIQNLMNDSNNKTNCSKIVKSFIPIDVQDLTIVYDKKYTVDENSWRTKIANTINNWTSLDSIRLNGLTDGFPAPVRISEVWYDNQTNMPFSFDVNGNVTGSRSITVGQEDYPSFAKMTMNCIDGSSKTYISTRQLHPLVISNGLSSTYRTCRYYIKPENIKFIKGAW